MQIKSWQIAIIGLFFQIIGVSTYLYQPTYQKHNECINKAIEWEKRISFNSPPNCKDLLLAVKEIHTWFIFIFSALIIIFLLSKKYEKIGLTFSIVIGLIEILISIWILNNFFNDLTALMYLISGIILLGNGAYCLRKKYNTSSSS